MYLNKMLTVADEHAADFTCRIKNEIRTAAESAYRIKIKVRIAVEFTYQKEGLSEIKRTILLYSPKRRRKFDGMVCC